MTHKEKLTYEETEIDRLAAAIVRDGKGDMLAFWRLVFALESWSFIATNETATAAPYAAKIPDGDDVVVFIFTHPKKAYDFAKTNAILASDGDVYVSSVPRENVFQYLAQYQSQGLNRAVFDVPDIGFDESIAALHGLAFRFQNERVLAETDFDALVESIRAGERDERIFWERAFAMGEWYLLARSDAPSMAIVAEYEDAPALLVFTDVPRLRSFAANQGIAENEDAARYLSLPVTDAKDTVARFMDGDGRHIVFNPGDSVWGATTEEFIGWANEFDSSSKNNSAS